MQNFLSYFVIPGIAILMPGKSRWLESNFSVVGSHAQGRAALILWGTATAWFFHYFLKRALRRSSVRIPVGRELLLTDISAILLFLSVFAPYLPEKFPLLSAAHVVCAFMASAFLYLVLFSITVKLYQENARRFRLIAGALVSLPPICAALFILAGNMISSATEIFFITVCSACLNRLCAKLDRIPGLTA